MTGLPNIRPARKSDAGDMVILVDGAGYGIPFWSWSGLRQTEASVLDIGRRRAMREEGSFSYRKAHILEHEGTTAGMLIGYLVEDPASATDLADMSDVIRPIAELEAMVAGSWYINILTLHEEFRGLGLGSRLLDLADTLARQAGASALSTIVESRNAGASALYQKNGFTEFGRRPRVPHPGDYTKSEEWVLLRKQL